MNFFLPMTQAGGMGSLPDLLELQAGDSAVAMAFQAAELPMNLLENKEQRIPLVSLMSLFEHAARLSNDPLLGLRIGSSMTPSAYGLWAAWAGQAPVLREALDRAETGITFYQSGTTMRVETRGPNRVAWAYYQLPNASHSYAQHSDHVVPTMISFLREFLGAGWSPDWIETHYPEPSHRTALEDATGAPWKFGKRGVAIVLPANALSTRRDDEDELKAGHPLTLIDIAAEAKKRISESPINRIESLILLRLHDGLTDIDGIIRQTGLSRRSFQRHLERLGLSYSALLERVRMKKAVSLLQGSQLPVTQIAYAVGYSDPSHFTRAFRRYFDQPPSGVRYRRSD